MLLFRRQYVVYASYYLRKSWKEYEQARDIARELEQDGELVKSTELNEDQNSTINNEKIRSNLIITQLSFGLGAFNYLVSTLPPMFKWIVELLGFEGNSQYGCEKLLEASSFDLKSIPRAVWGCIASVGLRWFFLDQKQEAYNQLELLLSIYPNSAIIQSFCGNIYRRDGKIEKSTDFFKQAQENANTLPQMQITIGYELATNLFLFNKFEEAIPLIERYLEKSTSTNFKAYGAYKLGFCYWMTNNKDKTFSLFSRLPDWVRPNMAYDTFAFRKSQKFLTQGNFSSFDELYLLASNLTDAKRFDEAIEILIKIRKTLLTSKTELIDEFAQYHYLKGLIFREIENIEKARKSLHKAICDFGPNIREEIWVVPHSYIELCECYVKLNDLTKARECINRTKKFTKYDFEKQLGIRIKKLQSFC
eukprot:TRINITY_DN1246_c1_g2_i2.p1 TRINITY_DN1246_c1_g2~~TRINITY_DN1246_c1_g2_i2.p1  ORF type:complete len:420 (-),score=151.28 TRINITY_DN1246_c1_g2_i2:112-1371(-)